MARAKQNKRKLKRQNKNKHGSVKALPTYSYKRNCESLENVINLRLSSASADTWTHGASEAFNAPIGAQRNAWIKLQETKLSDLIDHQEFTALYGLYRINCVVYQLTAEDTSTISSGQIQIQSVFDPAGLVDRNTTQNEFLSYQNCKKRNLILSNEHKPISYKFKPTLRVVVNATSTVEDAPVAITANSIISSKRAPWLPTSKPDIPHLAPQFAFSTTNGEDLAAHGGSFRVDKVIYVSFKNVR